MKIELIENIIGTTFTVHAVMMLCAGIWDVCNWRNCRSSDDELGVAYYDISRSARNITKWIARIALSIAAVGVITGIILMIVIIWKY